MTTDHQPNTTLTVEIVSILAAGAGAPLGMSWRGEVPLSLLGLTDPDRVDTDAVNDRLWVIFNRTDPAATDALGYRLPSLSVGDLLAWGGVTYRVAAPTGFEVLKPKQILSAALGATMAPELLRDLRAVVDHVSADEQERDGGIDEALQRLERYLAGEGVQ